jgi:hypothetical protein
VHDSTATMVKYTLATRRNCVVASSIIAPVKSSQYRATPLCFGPTAHA